MSVVAPLQDLKPVVEVRIHSCLTAQYIVEHFQ
jgi:hypothetical protein